jgi:hypothetical protein
VNRAGMGVAVRAVLREGSLSTAAVLERLEGKGWHGITDGELADALTSIGAWLSPDGEWLLQQPRRAQPRVSTALADELGVDPKELEGTPTAVSGSTGQAVQEVRGPLPQSWRTVSAQMRDALSAELTAAKASSQDQDVSLGDGRVVARTGRRLVYAFAVRGSVDAADGARCRVRLDTTWYDCEIVASSGSHVRLAVPRDAPDDETEALLRLDATFLLTEQVRFLDGIASFGPNFDVEAALALTQRAPSTVSASVGRPNQAAAPDPAVDGLNGEQAEAVRRARQGCSYGCQAA